MSRSHSGKLALSQVWTGSRVRSQGWGAARLPPPHAFMSSRPERHRANHGVHGAAPWRNLVAPTTPWRPDRSGAARVVSSAVQRSGGISSRARGHHPHTTPCAIPTGAAGNAPSHAWRSAVEGSAACLVARMPAPFVPHFTFFLLTPGAHSLHPCVHMGMAPQTTSRVPLLWLSSTHIQEMQVHGGVNAGSPPRQNPRHFK